jgi:hypothetical protein
VKSQIPLLAVLLIAATVSAQVTFVQPPAMVSSGTNQWTITFQVSQNTDVEVSIVRVQDSTVVRHLAAGVLGAAPPAPFAANSLSQTLTWDGKDDFGKLAANPQSLSVRVRAGATPRLAALAGENLYDNSGTPSIVTAKSGSVYILSNGSGQSPFLRKYDASGNYIKTIFPPPANLPSDSVLSYQINVIPGGGWVPKTYPVFGCGLQFGYLVMRGATISLNSAGQIIVSGKSGSKIIDTNGCFTDKSVNTFPKTRVDIMPAIPGARAGLIDASVRTGSYYAITGSTLQPSLAKYTGGKAAPSLTSSLPLSSSDQISSIAVAESKGATNIFVGFKNSGVRIYSDNGTGLKLLKDLAAFHDGPFVMERIAVDRTNDWVYWNGVNVISDWKNPVPRKLPLTIDNLTVAPNGFIYGWITGSVYNIQPIARYSSDGQCRPVPYSNTGNNHTTGEVYFEFGYSGTPGNHRGIAAGWQGQIAAFPEHSPLFQVLDTGSSFNTDNSTGAIQGNGKALVAASNYPASGDAQTREVFMGVKYDPAGNYYVGIRKISKPIVPSGFGLDPAFRDIGAVVKFNRDSIGTVDAVTSVLTGYDKIYPQPFGPFTQLASGAGVLCDALCTCRSSYFDVDPYGRLYVPNGVTCQVYVADNAGNNIAVFGQYGNTDSRGRLAGPGQLLSSPDFPLAWPTSVGASEDYVYVTDLVNARLMRVQMVYALDNIPGLTDRFSAAQKAPVRAGLKLAAHPNPFNPVSNITLSLPAESHVDLAVYGVNGRLVRTLAAGKFGPGNYFFTWDGKDAAGRNVCPGMYIYRLTAGSRVLMEKTILAK